MIHLVTVLFVALTLHKPEPPQAPEPVDARFAKLEMFFDRYQCPQPNYAFSYLRAADEYNLDYRLLPAISVRESTCGVHDRWNNRWGWDSAWARFSSVPRGIEFISRELTIGTPYRDRSVPGKLHKYNPKSALRGSGRKVMREIDRTP